MSITRKRYVAKLIGRIIIFILCLIMCTKPQFFNILKGMNFFDEFHILHLLWIIWMYDTILQIIPIKNKIALGSQKLFANRYKKAEEDKNFKDILKKYIKSTNIGALKVLVSWVLLTTIIGVLYYTDTINEIWLFMICIFFYVCDLICVLVWCPFRLMMKNKCCTTCRIFNWDHLMMFTPLIFIGGFYSLSLVAIAVLAVIVWELSILIHPERFSEVTNVSLRCTNCTDKLCTQYCQKKKQNTQE